ncbi:hypothetical protein [uncultured Dokdonia sp.]|uniref:hypothetical protein n=1 Tax=uncultured Dokdonia sp. TaxID=575653 RepID=UPI00260DF860|nr:hypothetical protein [uncultured Dokdonia sp.]
MANHQNVKIKVVSKGSFFCIRINPIDSKYQTTTPNASIFPHYYLYIHDDQRNPLLSNTNLKDIIAFIPELRQEMNQFYIFFSENNRIQVNEPGGPPDEWFSEYQFNEYDLPTERYSSYFYNDQQQGETSLSAIYYYQEE